MELIPRVEFKKEFAPQCEPGGYTRLRYAGLNGKTLGMLAGRFPNLKEKTMGQGFFVSLTRSRAKELPASEVPGGFDAYALKAEKNAIRIDAHDGDGLFFGIQTLLSFPDFFSEVEIRDRAKIRRRIVHWDLKGYQPRLGILLEELEILASMKINGILLEPEDKYNYRCAPGIGVPGAYTFDELRKLSRYAAELHIQIIPKLQSVAHADYLLKHPNYRKYRENGHVYQYCLTDSGAQKLWESMARELMECFQEHDRYFHIGADEPLYLGECRRCKKKGGPQAYIGKPVSAIWKSI